MEGVNLPQLLPGVPAAADVPTGGFQLPTSPLGHDPQPRQHTLFGADASAKGTNHLAGEREARLPLHLQLACRFLKEFYKGLHVRGPADIPPCQGPECEHLDLLCGRIVGRGLEKGCQKLPGLCGVSFRVG